MDEKEEAQSELNALEAEYNTTKDPKRKEEILARSNELLPKVLPTHVMDSVDTSLTPNTPVV